MKGTFRRKCEFACSLLAVLVLLVSTAAAVPAKQSPPVEPAPLAEITLPGPGSSQDASATAACPTASLIQVGAPNVDRSDTTPIYGSSYFDSGFTTDHRQFWAHAEAFAGYTTILGCFLNANCSILDYLKNIVITTGSGHGTVAINDVTLRLDGPPGARASINTTSSVDGLIIGGALLGAQANSNITVQTGMRTPAGSYTLIDNYYSKNATALQQFREHKWWNANQTAVLKVGDVVHITGLVRAESASVSIVGAAAGVSYYGHVEGVSANEVPDPGMWIQVNLTNTIPTIGVDKPAVSAGFGEKAILTGVYCDGDADALTITQSLGTTVDNHDGTWQWYYTIRPYDLPGSSRTVTIRANDTKGAYAETTFTLNVVQKIYLPVMAR